MMQHEQTDRTNPSEGGSKTRTVLLTIAAGILISTGPVSAIDASERTYYIPSVDDPTINKKNGSELVSLPPLTEPGIVFTSFREYQTYRDDDFSVSIQETSADELELAWKNGHGYAGIMVHRIALPDGVHLFHRREFNSSYLRNHDLPMRQQWVMKEGDRCVVIVELRKTWGSDDDASYRFKTNNTNDGNEICILHADLGHGKRDFRFMVTVLVWNPDETDFDVTVNRISTSRNFEVTDVSGLSESDVRISNPLVDWGSDDDVRFRLDAGSFRTHATLKRAYGFREIEFELIGLSSSAEDM